MSPEIFKGSPTGEFRGGNAKALTRLANAEKPIFSRITEHLQVQGHETLPEGPLLLAFNHDTRHDFVNLPQVWKDYVPQLIIKAVSRIGILDIGSFHGADRLFGWATRSLLTRSVTRIEEGMSEEEKAELKERNKEAMERVMEEIRNGVSYIMAPTGTTKGDGTIPPVKKGAYKLSYFENGAGETKLIECVPLISTYDFMTGFKNRVSAVFGKPFTANPELGEQEGAEDFAEKFRQAYADYNTFTTSQIGSRLIYQLIEQGKGQLLLNEWEDFCETIVERLSERSRSEVIYMDEGLKDEMIRSFLVERFYDRLIKLGYLDKNGHINTERAQAKPVLKHFKKENPLLYTFNRIETVLERRTSLRPVFNGA